MSNGHIMVIARTYASSGSTGSVVVPVGAGGPAFAGLWCFVQPAQEVAIAVGAA